MMHCDQCEPLLTDYLDGNLDEEHQLQFDEHLAACKSCRANVERARHSEALLGLAAETALQTESLSLNAVGIVQRSVQRAQRHGRRWRRVALLSAVAVILVSSLNLAAVRCEIRSTHLVLAWGAGSPDTSETASESLQKLRGQIIDYRSQLDELEQLLGLVFAEIKAHNELEPSLVAFCARLDRRLAQMEQRQDQRWQTTKKLIRRWQPPQTVALHSRQTGAGE